MIEARARTPEETAAVGEVLARFLFEARSLEHLGAWPVVIFLSGDLGAGKTTFAQGFIRGCGVRDAVRSPTYALMEPYEAQHFTLLHLDLYRLQAPSELEPLGLRDWARAGTVWLVEWPERGQGRLPQPDLSIRLGVEAAMHRLILEPQTAFGRDWLARFTAA
jgi:tRNA threonylcarbamoyladenosine biosynthesis protein TsaE